VTHNMILNYLFPDCPKQDFIIMTVLKTQRKKCEFYDELTPNVVVESGLLFRIPKIPSSSLEAGNDCHD
jgi:hypothetical protein